MERTTAASPDPTGESPVRVLLVDDEPEVRLVVGKHLARRGWTVDKVLDGGEALAAASNVTYDAVVLDQQLPDRTGLEVAGRLDDTLPVVIFSAPSDRGLCDAAAQAGCRVVDKDDLDALVAVIEEVAAT